MRWERRRRPVVPVQVGQDPRTLRSGGTEDGTSHRGRAVRMQVT